MVALPPRHIISKSTFVRGCQCVKSLWLYKNHFHLRDQPGTQQERIFMQGTNVGLLARQLFGRGVDASPANVFHYRESVRDTAKYISQGHTVIFEAAFQHEGILCAVDVLIKHKDKWYVYEVKSSTGVKDQYMQDAALQHYVISKAGLQLEDIFIVHINNKYVRCGELQLRQLLTKQSVKQQVLEMQPAIESKIKELKIIAAQKFMPAISTGDHCSTPYGCDFYSFCSKEADLQVTTEQKIITDKVNEKSLKCQPEYPITFMEVNTYRVAVPEYDGHWPYRRIPFGFSVYKVSKLGEESNTFFADHRINPCIQLIEKLVRAAGTEGSIIVSNANFLAVRLSELSSEFPEYIDALENISKRLYGINVFEKEHSGFIKSADDAAAAWYNLRFEKDEQQRQIVKQELNEYAMYKILAMANFINDCDNRYGKDLAIHDTSNDGEVVAIKI